MGSVRFPWDISQSDCIDLCVEIFVIGDGGEVVMGDECSTPDVKELVDDVSREMGLEV